MRITARFRQRVFDPLEMREKLKATQAYHLDTKRKKYVYIVYILGQRHDVLSFDL